MAFDRPLNERIVLSERGGVPIRIVLVQAGTAFDVREREGHTTGR
jgi:hypothetical protein